MKQNYKKPVVNRILLDNTISLIMMSNNGNGNGWGPGGKPKKSKDETFESPFNNTQFN